MLERQREGIAKAKREGRYKGRVPTVRRRAAEAQRVGVRPSEIASRLGTSRASIYRSLGEEAAIVRQSCWATLPGLDCVANREEKQCSGH